MEGNIEETRHLSAETCPRQIKSSDENLNTNKNKEEGKQREPGSTADYDKAIGLIFCPSCCGSQEQLQWQGSIRSAIPLLHSLSRSIINDTEKQKRSSRARCPAHAGATGGGGGGGYKERKDMLLALLIHQLKLKGTRGKWNRKGKTITLTCFCPLGYNHIGLFPLTSTLCVMSNNLM